MGGEARSWGGARFYCRHHQAVPLAASECHLGALNCDIKDERASELDHSLWGDPNSLLGGARHNLEIAVPGLSDKGAHLWSVNTAAIRHLSGPGQNQVLSQDRVGRMDTLTCSEQG